LGAAYARALQAERELERVLAGPSSFEIELAEIDIEQAKIKLDNAVAAFEDTRLIAPFDAIVSAVNVELGSLAAPGVPLLTLTDVSQLQIMAEVDEVDIRRIHVGMPARIQFDALENTRLDGVIERIAVLGRDEDGIVSYDVTLRLDEIDPRVRDGMTAEAAVIVEERQDVLVVPNMFVRLDRTNDQAYVNVVQSDGTLEEVQVRLGLQGQDNSEVLAGLNSGDVIGLDLNAERFSFIGG
jgi:RND family efflux transporter MFP subunit